MAPHQDIRLLRINYLRGPNIWTYRPALEVWLDLGALEDWPSNRIDGLNARLTAWLPALIEHHCGVGERGGFLQRLQEGTWCGHVLEHIVIELLNLAGMPTGFGQTRSTSQTGVYRMVFRARDEQVARVALAQGHRLLMAAINGQPFDVQAAVARVRTEVDDRYLGPSTACIVAAATERGIPHIRLNAGNLVQLGYGAAQRRIWTAETECTSAIAEGIAADKDLTRRLLKSCGVPVPEGRVVHSAEDAWAAAQELGLPVVVKPSDGNHGRGVTLELQRQDDIAAAFALALPEGSAVLVERFIPGAEHRLLVVGGKVVAAARGEMVTITGNGHATVAELIASQINCDPRRGPEEEYPLEMVDIATQASVQQELRRQQVGADTVPAAGRQIVVQRNGNVALDCSDEVHPEVAHCAVLAARVVGLDIAGIDLVARDIAQPLQRQGGAVVEVNAGPGLLMHLKPAVGAPRPVGQAIVEHLFAPDKADKGERPDKPLRPESEAASGGAGRIPLVGVAGTRGTDTIARLVAWLLHLSGRQTGLACRAGLFLDHRRVQAGDCTHWEAAHRLLMNKLMQAAVIESSPRTILRDGLAYDRCLVAVVTDMDGVQDLAEFDVHEQAQMTRVLRTQVDVVLPGGSAVLNAAIAQVAELAPLSDGAVLLYAQDAQLPAIAEHRAAGGRAVLVERGRVLLASGASAQPLGLLAELRFGRQALRPDTDALLAAIAAAWALDIAPDLMAAGIKTFEPELPAAAGRAAQPQREQPEAEPVAAAL